MHDPLIFVRKTLENAFDARDEAVVRAMSAMIDEAMLSLNRDDVLESDGEQTG